MLKTFSKKAPILIFRAYQYIPHSTPTSYWWHSSSKRSASPILQDMWNLGNELRLMHCYHYTPNHEELPLSFFVVVTKLQIDILDINKLSWMRQPITVKSCLKISNLLHIQDHGIFSDTLMLVKVGQLFPFSGWQNKQEVEMVFPKSHICKSHYEHRTINLRRK